MNSCRRATGQFRPYEEALQGETLGHQFPISMEYQGLSECCFLGALHDPFTIHADGMPAITMLEHHPWVNQELLGRICNGAYYLSDIRDLAQPQTFEYALDNGIRRCRDNQRGLFFEGCAERVANMEDLVTARARALGFTAINRLTDPSLYMRTQFASIIRNLQSAHTPDAAWTFETLEHSNPHDGQDGAHSYLRVDEVFIEKLWSFYEPRFEEICTDDPITARLTAEEFTEIMDDPRFLKIVQVKKGEPVALGLLADIRTCDWMNQHFFRFHFPDKYDKGLVWYSLGILTKDKADISSVKALFGPMRQLVTTHHVEPIFSFVCNSTSNKTVPKLVNRYLNTEPLTTALQTPVCTQRYAAFVFD